jgi:hypothetical protein
MYNKLFNLKLQHLILLGVLLTLFFFEAYTKGDMEIFIGASKDLLKGNNIYQIKYHEWYHYYYDIGFALIIVPLSYIPAFWANFIWSIINLFFTYRIFKITFKYLPFTDLDKSIVTIFTIITSIFIFGLWYRNIHLGQMTIFILYLCLEGIQLINNKKSIAGSLLIAIGISIKILPIVLLPYLLYRGRFKAFIYIIIIVVLLLLLPCIIIGYEYNSFLLNERWQLINPLNNAHILDDSERSFHSLTSLLSILLVENAGNKYSLDISRNIADISLENLKLIIAAVRLFFVIGSLYFIKSYPFKKPSSKLQEYYELSYIFLVIPLIFPHQQHYAFSLHFQQ